MLGVLLILTFYRISFSTPKTFFLFCGWWMVCAWIMTISKMSRGQSYSWISSPTRLDAWEFVYTSGVHKAYAGHIQSKKTKNLGPIDHPLPTKYNKSLPVDSGILFKYKTIKWIPSRMASRFLDKWNFNEIQNEQRSVILIYIIKRIFSPWEENAKPFC